MSKSRLINRNYTIRVIQQNYTTEIKQTGKMEKMNRALGICEIILKGLPGRKEIKKAEKY